jgi:hypothetical protein
VHLGGWSDWGFELVRWEANTGGWVESVVLLDAAGTESATLGDGIRFAPGPGGAIWTEEASEREAASYLVPADGDTPESVPGLADGEWVVGALWSADGSFLALSPGRSVPDTQESIRIVEAATGTIVGEIVEPERDVSPMAWSTDGRFLFYERMSDVPEQDPPVDWVVYDIATGSATELPIPEGRFVSELRTVPAPVVGQFTPVEWGIDVAEVSPGSAVYVVSMIADVGPLVPDGVEELWGKLIWDETTLDLCNLAIREVGDGFLHIGDIFRTIEECGHDPTMQEAFDEFGIPQTACLAVRVNGLDYEHCDPLD